MKKKNKETKSLGLAVYFGVLVIIIILVSVIFKAVDTIKNSKFDGKHSLSVAVIEPDKTEIVFASPADGSISELSLPDELDIAELNSLGIPTDAYLSGKSVENPKTFFIKSLLHRRSIKTDLTVLDLLRLSLFSQGVSSENVKKESVSVKGDELSSEISDLFQDPSIVSEKESIMITNSTQVAGLGNKISLYISNLGGDVVLVNSSPNVAKKSVIYYKEESYTVDRLSKILKIAKQKKTDDSISDITIIIGEDKSEF
jgi:hypothetical protein